MDLGKLRLIRAQLEDYPVIQNMARFYVYDMTQYMGLSLDGKFQKLDYINALTLKNIG